MKGTNIDKMTLDQKIELAQRLLISITEDEIGWECSPGLCRWLHTTADQLDVRCA